MAEEKLDLSLEMSSRKDFKMSGKSAGGSSMFGTKMWWWEKKQVSDGNPQRKFYYYNFQFFGSILAVFNLMNLQTTWYPFVRSRFVILAMETSVTEKLCPYNLETPPDHPPLFPLDHKSIETNRILIAVT